MKTRRGVDRPVEQNPQKSADAIGMKSYAIKVGRVAAQPVLLLYYVMRSEEAPLKDKLTIFGALAYVILPVDLLNAKRLPKSWGQELLYTKYSLKPHNGNWSFWQAATNTTWAKARAATRVVRSTRFTEACAIWLATRMGMPTVKDAPGIEIVQTNNLLTHDQIVGMVMKKLA